MSLPVSDLIHKGKVLLIVNSNSAISNAVADYYINARNLGGHKLTFAFSSKIQIPTAEFAAVKVTVDEYITSNNIEAIICSAEVPFGIQGNYSFAAKLAEQLFPGGIIAPGHKVRYFVDNAYNKIKETTGASWQSHYVTVMSTTDFNLFDWRTQKHKFPLPYGRLGFGKFHTYYPEESFEFCKRVIDDAIASETTLSFYSNKALPLHFSRGWFSSSIYPTPPTSYPWGAFNGTPYTDFARRQLQEYGATNCKILTAGDTTEFPTRPGNDYWVSNYDNNTIPLNCKDLWGFIGFHRNLYGSNSSDSSVFAGRANRYNHLPGSWSIGGASYGCSELGVRFLLDGACAAAGTVYEPLVTGLHEVDTIAAFLRQGFSLAEACRFGNPKPHQDIWGDPLYTPFLKPSFPDGTVRTLQIFKA